jgi:signal transduction histidine kinase
VIEPAHSGNDDAHELARSEVAHAFRTPLGVITGYVELMRRRDGDVDLRTEGLGQIEQAAARLSTAIDNLLEVLDDDHDPLAAPFLERWQALDPRLRRDP